MPNPEWGNTDEADMVPSPFPQEAHINQQRCTAQTLRAGAESSEQVNHLSLT